MRPQLEVQKHEPSITFTGEPNSGSDLAVGSTDQVIARQRQAFHHLQNPSTPEGILAPFMTYHSFAFIEDPRQLQ